MILIRKVKDPYGWLGNMSPHPIEHQGLKYLTTEALFQCLRFDSQEITELIRAKKSPMSAKMVAKSHADKRIVEPLSTQDVDNMRLCLKLKIEQHPKVLTDLLATGEEEIVEDCTKRPYGSGIFWGMAFQKGHWTGDNILGKLWMELRHRQQKLYGC